MIDSGNFYPYDVNGISEFFNYLALKAEIDTNMTDHTTSMNDDDTELFQTYSGISFLDGTNFVVCWQDHRNGENNPDIDG